MNFIISFLAYFILGGFASYFLPWWIIAPIGVALGSFYKGKPGFAFLFGLASQLLLWLGMATWLSIQNEGLMLGKMGKLLGELSPLLLLMAIGMIGGFTGGLSSWTGKLLQQVVRK